jgi:hypothetical protein
MEGGLNMKKKIIALMMVGLLAASSMTVTATAPAPTPPDTSHTSDASKAGIEFTGGLTDGVKDPDPTIPGTSAWTLNTTPLCFGTHGITTALGRTHNAANGNRIEFDSLVDADATEGRSVDIVVVMAGSQFASPTGTPTAATWELNVAVSGFIPQGSTTTTNRLNGFNLTLRPNATFNSGSPQVSAVLGGTSSYVSTITPIQAATDNIAMGTSTRVLRGNQGIFGASFNAILGVHPASITDVEEYQATLTWTFNPTGPTA